MRELPGGGRRCLRRVKLCTDKSSSLLPVARRHDANGCAAVGLRKTSADVNLYTGSVPGSGSLPGVAISWGLAISGLVGCGGAQRRPGSVD